VNVIQCIQNIQSCVGPLLLIDNILFACLMVFDATFNNISIISWWSVLLMDETGGPGKNHRPVASHCQTFSHNEYTPP